MEMLFLYHKNTFSNFRFGQKRLFYSRDSDTCSDLIFQQLPFQAILMDTNCSMKTRSYSTQGTYYQGEDIDPEYDDYD